MPAQHRMTFFVRQEGHGPNEGQVVSVHAEDRATALDYLIENYGAIEYHELPEEVAAHWAPTY